MPIMPHKNSSGSAIAACRGIPTKHMSVIYFIRHGQASFASEDYDRLSALGHVQSEILGKYLARLEVRFHGVYTGTLRRQRETAQAVLAHMPQAAGLSVVQTEGLNEYDSQGVISSQLPAMIEEDPRFAQDARHMEERRSFQRVFEGAMLRWASGRHDRPGVESWAGFSDRVRGAIRRIMQENGRHKSIAVFTSGGPICASVQMALGITAETAVRLNWQIMNTSVSEFKYNDTGIFMASFNSVHHLRLERRPELLTYR